MHARRKRARCRKPCAERQLVSVDLMEAKRHARRAQVSKNKKPGEGFLPAGHNSKLIITPIALRHAFVNGVLRTDSRSQADASRREAGGGLKIPMRPRRRFVF
jgi:hypothetical protein